MASKARSVDLTPALIARAVEAWHHPLRAGLPVREQARAVLNAAFYDNLRAVTPVDTGMMDRAAVFIAIGAMDDKLLDEAIKALLEASLDRNAPRSVLEAVAAGTTPIPAAAVHRAGVALSVPGLKRTTPVEIARHVVTCALTEPGQRPALVQHESVLASSAVMASEEWKVMDTTERAYAMVLAARRAAIAYPGPDPQFNAPPRTLTSFPGGWEIVLNGVYYEAQLGRSAPVIRSCRGNDEAVFLASIADDHEAARREIAELRSALAFIATYRPSEDSDRCLAECFAAMQNVASQAIGDVDSALVASKPDAGTLTPGAIKRAMMSAHAYLPDAVTAHPARMQWMGEHFLRTLGVLPPDHEPARDPSPAKAPRKRAATPTTRPAREDTTQAYTRVIRGMGKDDPA